VGFNVQADKHAKMTGIEGVFATSIGTLSMNLSLSDIKGAGSGYASVTTFQRMIQRADGRTDSLNLALETRSKNFGPAGTVLPNNPYQWDASGGYSHAFNDRLYGGVDGRYSSARGGFRDAQTYRATMGYRISNTASLTADARYERDNFGERVSALFSLNVRLGRFSSSRADYDTRDNRSRLSLQTLQGQGVGSFNLSADVERSDNSAGTSVNANYFANRAELGLSHFGTYTDSFGRSLGQRTSVRAATSFAFADGAFSVGRPIYDSFAIVQGHRSLKGTNVVVEPTSFGFTAETGILNAATQPNMSSYSERTTSIDAPLAPGGFDLGQGSFLAYPPYKSGYVFTVGSEYSITAIGRLLNEDGEPISFLTGTATEIGNPDHPELIVFTNREGRFGISGLRPGKWRLNMLDDRKSVFEFTIPENAEGAVKLGDQTARKGQ
jgi:outer membrane usher protein